MCHANIEIINIYITSSTYIHTQILIHLSICESWCETASFTTFLHPRTHILLYKHWIFSFNFCCLRWRMSNTHWLHHTSLIRHVQTHKRLRRKQEIPTQIHVNTYTFIHLVNHFLLDIYLYIVFTRIWILLLSSTATKSYVQQPTTIEKSQKRTSNDGWAWDINITKVTQSNEAYKNLEQCQWKSAVLSSQQTTLECC